MAARIFGNEAECRTLFNALCGLNRDLELFERGRRQPAGVIGQMPQALCARVSTIQKQAEAFSANKHHLRRCHFLFSIPREVSFLSQRMQRIEPFASPIAFPVLEIDPEAKIKRIINKSQRNPSLAVVLQCAPEADSDKAFTPWSPALLAMYINLAKVFHVYRKIIADANLQFYLSVAKLHLCKNIQVVILIGHGSKAGIKFGTGKCGKYGKDRPHLEMFGPVARNGEVVLLSCQTATLAHEISKKTGLVVSAPAEAFKVPASYVSVVQGKVQAYHLGCETKTLSTRKFSQGRPQQMPDISQVVETLSRWAQEGDVGAAHFCRIYALVRGNAAEARKWYEVAAQSGDPFSVGVWGLKLLGSQKEEGERLLKRAAAQGEPDALFYLGRHYYRLKKYAEAFPILLKAKEKSSSPEIDTMLSLMYTRGLGTDPNPDLARFRKEQSEGRLQAS